jgi:hypothetical protein
MKYCDVSGNYFWACSNGVLIAVTHGLTFSKDFLVDACVCSTDTGNRTENETLSDSDQCWESTHLTRLDAYRIFVVSKSKN